MDKIFLKGLKLKAHIGIYEWEQRVEQTVLIDLEMYTNISEAANIDDINLTLNYFTVAKRIEKLIHEQHFNLVETLANTIAEILQTEFSVKKLRLTVGKPSALANAEVVGVTIERDNV